MECLNTERIQHKYAKNTDKTKQKCGKMRGMFTENVENSRNKYILRQLATVNRIKMIASLPFGWFPLSTNPFNLSILLLAHTGHASGYNFV